MGDTLAALKDGCTVPVAYETRFLITWPAHLGGGAIEIDLDGTMLLNPLLAVS